jgi:hypothetical protein
MQIGLIIDEFRDYRAYVSHTLCKHRLSLGLQTAEGARARLRDASVWPLVPDEAMRLITLSSSLFGMVEPEYDAVNARIREACTALKNAASQLLNGCDDALPLLQGCVVALGDELSSAAVVMDHRQPQPCADDIVRYLGPRALSRLEEKLQGAVLQIAELYLTPLFLSRSKWSVAYQAFWPAAADAYLLTRTIIVAHAVADGDDDSAVGLRHVQWLIRGVERIVSCWSPGIAASDRSRFLDQSLRACGFSSPESLVEHLKVCVVE